VTWWLPEASDSAAETDRLLFGLLLLTFAVLALVFGLMFRYIVRYRAGSALDRSAVSKKSWIFEITWTAATLLIFLGLFVWGADLYVRLSRPPENALKIYVIAKQWMWKVEHAGGQRELNALHVPLGIPVELVMTSEDVIHDFSIPAFRIKHDVLPGRYQTLSFTATRPGEYTLYCTQFCGVDHSKMVGTVVVLPQPLFQAWLGQSESSGSLAAAGRTLFMRFGCGGCHGSDGTGSDSGSVRAPSLAGLYGSRVVLADGTATVADEGYLHDGIVMPERQPVSGYAPIMPSFAGQLGEEELLQLVAYIKSLAPSEAR
jgi:cytochrome c oxidase subunit II